MENIILDYLFTKNSIPVWALDSSDKIVYSNFLKEELNPSGASEFLEYFRQDAEDFPKIKKLLNFENYASFKLKNQDEELLIIVGPAFEIHPMCSEIPLRHSLYYLLGHDYIKKILLHTSEISNEEFCKYVIIIANLLLKKQYNIKVLQQNTEELPLKKIIDKQLISVLFDIREEERMTAYAPELEEEVLACVRSGDTEKIKAYKLPTIRDPNAKRTKNQRLFEVVAMVTLATRAAVDGGLDVVTAYSLSDLYFKKLSDISSEKQIDIIAGQVFSHFTERVKAAKAENLTDKPYSPYIVKSIQYIRTHLHYTINLCDVAEYVGVSEKYLSRLFVTCLKEKFSSYVQRERIAESKALLENTDRSLIDISTSLAFSSESYFIKIFTKYAGITPKQFLTKVKIRR